MAALSCLRDTLAGMFGSVLVSHNSGAAFERIARITRWGVDLTCDGVRFVSSDVGAWTQFIPSVRTAVGRLEFKWSAARLQTNVMNVGDVVRLFLSMDDSQLDVAIPAFWIINEAVITSVDVVVDIESGEVVSGSMGFEANGPIVFPG